MMGEIINGWGISKVRGLGGFDYWISKSGKSKGRAVKTGKVWTAFEVNGHDPMFACDGVDASAETLDGLVMALADAEVSIAAEKENRAKRRMLADPKFAKYNQKRVRLADYSITREDAVTVKPAFDRMAAKYGKVGAISKAIIEMDSRDEK